MATEIEHLALAIIDNFQSSESFIEITPNLSIVNIDALPAEQSQYFNRVIRVEETHNLLKQPNEIIKYVTHLNSSNEEVTRSPQRANHVLRWHFAGEVPDPFKDNYNLLFGATYEFEYVLVALRLLKRAEIGLFPQEEFFIKAPLPAGFRTSTHQAIGYELTNPFEVEPYVFYPSEIETLKNLYLAVKQAKLPRLNTALRRLYNQYTRSYLADRIIDAVVALEALYFDDSVQTELQYRMGVRIAAHLGGADAAERDRLFKLAATAYNLRSKIIHGSLHSEAEIENFKDLKKGGWSNADHLLADVTDLLRKSLRSILLDVTEAGLKDFHSRLDACIRRGEPFTV
jgi:hypothetical protein